MDDPDFVDDIESSSRSSSRSRSSSQIEPEEAEDFVADDEESISELIRETDVSDGFVEVTTTSTNNSSNSKSGEATAKTKTSSSRLNAQSSPNTAGSDSEDTDSTASSRAADAANDASSRIAGLSLAKHLSHEAVLYAESWRMFLGDVLSEMRNPTRPMTTEVCVCVCVCVHERGAGVPA